MLQKDILKGSKGALAGNTRQNFQVGMPLRHLGLSLWELSKRRRDYHLADINGQVSQFVCYG